MSVTSAILKRVRGRGRGTVFTAKDFLDVGSRAAVDQALTRLARTGRVRRIDRGVYDYPRTLSGGSHTSALWPSTDAVAQAVADQTDSHLQVSGAAAANALGLSTQVPAQVEYLTDGPSRRVRVGNLVVRLKHAGRIDMLLPRTRAGMAIVALRHFGKSSASDSSVLQRLSSTLDDNDKRQLADVRPKLPGWLGSAVNSIVAASPVRA